MTDQLLAASSARPRLYDDGTVGDTDSGQRPTATARDPRSGRPLDRCVYTADMLARLARESLDAARSSTRTPPRTAALSQVEAEIIAELLDELAGVYPTEELGQLAGTLSARLRDRLAR